MSCRVGAGVRWLEVDDGVVIFNPGTVTFIDLDERGAELWLTMSETGWDDVALVRHLVDEFGSAPAEASQVVNAFVDDLVRLGVLHRAVG